MDPPKRVETLLKFAERVTQTSAVTDVLYSFDMEMNPELTELNGRILAPELVSLKWENGYKSVEADWTRGDLQI